ncbi:MAG TPA: hypothetical protein PKB14_11950 [Rubrivivax sp.]|nr:hypothetical protein [Rubrivivax sp.]
MHNLVAWLSRIDDRALDRVVHVGAGAGAVLEQYAALPAARRPRQVVLIEGDAELARSLERAAAPFPWARVLPVPVGAQGGSMTWHRFNLRMLNGPLDAAALVSAYPRLRRVQTTTLRCEALSDVLNSLDPDLKPGKDKGKGLAHALVLDVPGQECALLESLTPDQLRQFHAISWRGCRVALPPQGQAAALAHEWLARQHFAVAASAGEGETLWPEALMRFDSIGDELARLRLQVTRMDAALEERDRLTRELQTATQAKAAAEKLAADRLAKSAEQDERLRRLDLQLADAVKERDRLTRELQTAAQAKAAAEKLAADRQSKSAEQADDTRRLEVQLADANMRLELLQQEVLKAEAQLSLIKELVLKEPSL